MKEKVLCPTCKKELEFYRRKAVCKKCKKEYVLEMKWYLTALELTVFLIVLFSLQKLLFHFISISIIVGMISCLITLLLYFIWNKVLTILIPLQKIYNIRTR